MADVFKEIEEVSAALPPSGVGLVLGDSLGHITAALQKSTFAQSITLINPWAYDENSKSDEFGKPIRGYARSLGLTPQELLDLRYRGTQRRFETSENIHIHRTDFAQFMKDHSDFHPDWIYLGHDIRTEPFANDLIRAFEFSRPKAVIMGAYWSENIDHEYPVQTVINQIKTNIAFCNRWEEFDHLHHIWHFVKR